MSHWYFEVPIYNGPRNDQALAFKIINTIYNIYYSNHEFLKSTRWFYSKYIKLIRHLKIPDFSWGFKFVKNVEWT